MGLASRITVLPLRELENYEVEFLFSYRYLALGPVDLVPRRFQETVSNIKNFILQAIIRLVHLVDIVLARL
jgi:hypothetical protein